MLSATAYARIRSVLAENWHYNDTGKAYAPDVWTAFMRKYYSLLFRYYLPATKESCPTDALQDKSAQNAVSDLLRTKTLLSQRCDPASLRIHVWRLDAIPDMRKNADLAFTAAPNTRYDEGFDADSFQPGFVPYWVEDDLPHPVILVLSGGHRVHYCCGEPACRYFQRHGFHAVLLCQRVGPNQKLNACLDLQRTIRYLRYHTQKYRIMPDGIAALGFSLGGVAIISYLEQMHAEDAPDQYVPEYTPDSIDHVSGNLNAFLGIYTSSAPDVERSPATNYSEYPPVFLVQPGADPKLHFQIAYLHDLVQHNVSVESHLFDGGMHNFGLGDGKILPVGKDGEQIPAIALWPHLATLWLRRVLHLPPDETL